MIVRMSQKLHSGPAFKFAATKLYWFPAGIWTQQAGCQLLQSLNFVYTILSPGLELLLHSATFAA
jgi:hypothetical protein